jgi:hypothetical protein
VHIELGSQQVIQFTGLNGGGDGAGAAALHEQPRRETLTCPSSPARSSAGAPGPLPAVADGQGVRLPGQQRHPRRQAPGGAQRAVGAGPGAAPPARRAGGSGPAGGRPRRCWRGAPIFRRKSAWTWRASWKI